MAVPAEIDFRRHRHPHENPDGDATDDVVAVVRQLSEDWPLRGDRDAGVALTKEQI